MILKRDVFSRWRNV